MVLSYVDFISQSKIGLLDLYKGPRLPWAATAIVLDTMFASPLSKVRLETEKRRALQLC